MAKPNYCSIIDAKPGTKILIDCTPFNIVENEFVKPGKGQAFNRIRIKNLKNGNVIEKTFKSNEMVDVADVIELELQYLYNDGTSAYFMSNDDFHQHEVNTSIIEDSLKWLKGEELCMVTIFDGAIISVTPPNFVTLKVIETEPAFKGDTVSGGGKPAIMETGVSIKVPFFVDIGDIIKIDTRNGEYLSREQKR